MVSEREPNSVAAPAGCDVVIAAGDASLRVCAEGAEPISWMVGGRELLWQAGASWPRSSPVLFPIVGRARNGRIKVDGRTYPIGVHGFAANEMFSATVTGPSSAVFVLEDNASTRAQYPFAFRLELSYRLGARDLEIGVKVRNRSDVTMPYAVGLHPGFAWPFAGGTADGYRVEFGKPENPFVPVIDGNGLFTSGARSVPLGGRTLALSHDLMAREALCFLNANSDTVRFVASSGDAIAVKTDGFPHLALWARPPAPFLCIESWTGHGDPDDFDGELAQKPSMSLLAPGASRSHAIRWRFEPGDA